MMEPDRMEYIMSARVWDSSEVAFDPVVLSFNNFVETSLSERNPDRPIPLHVIRKCQLWTIRHKAVAEVVDDWSNRCCGFILCSHNKG